MMIQVEVPYDKQVYLMHRPAVNADGHTEEFLCDSPSVGIFAAQEYRIWRNKDCEYVKISNQLHLSNNKDYCLLFIPFGVLAHPQVMYDMQYEIMVYRNNPICTKIRKGQLLGEAFMVPRCSFIPQRF